MTILLTILLSASLSTALPAACIADLGPRPLPQEPAWRSLLPTLVIGVDRGADGGSGFQFEGRREASLSSFQNDGADQRQDHRKLTRWVVTLRWQTTPRQEPIPPSGGDSASSHCRALAQLLARRPAELPALIDHSTELARLRALIDATATREE